MSNWDKPFSRLQLSAWKYHVLITLDGGCSTWLLVLATLFLLSWNSWILNSQIEQSLHCCCWQRNDKIAQCFRISQKSHFARIRKLFHQRRHLTIFVENFQNGRKKLGGFSNTVDWCTRCTSLLWHFFVFQRFYSLVILFWQHCHVNNYFCTASKGSNKAASRS